MAYRIDVKPTCTETANKRDDVWNNQTHDTLSSGPRQASPSHTANV